MLSSAPLTISKRKSMKGRGGSSNLSTTCVHAAITTDLSGVGVGGCAGGASVVARRGCHKLQSDTTLSPIPIASASREAPFRVDSTSRRGILPSHRSAMSAASVVRKSASSRGNVNSSLKSCHLDMLEKLQLLDLKRLLSLSGGQSHSAIMYVALRRSCDLVWDADFSQGGRTCVVPLC
jgi:hypothetical protein